MEDFDSLPPHYIASITRIENALGAHYVNDYGSDFPLDHKKFLYKEGSWQKAVIEKLMETLFKGVPTDKLKGKSSAYLNGYISGFMKSAFQSVADDEIPLDKFEGSIAVEALKKLTDEKIEHAKKVSEAYLNQLSISEQAEYYKGSADGLTSIVSEGNFKHETDASQAYYAMLVSSDELKFLETWRDFHEFISSVVPSYSDEKRFFACRKLAQRVGFSPLKEHGKNHAN